MIFIATGANASANNLGKITIKTVADIAPDTIAKIDYFGKTWTDDQKIALDDFLVSFNAASWKSKVKVLSIPVLIPVQNKIPVSTLTASGGKFRKNIADWDNQITTLVAASDETFGFIGVGANGLVLQNNTAGTATFANLGIDIQTTSFGITNKAAHYGAYFKATNKFACGSASSTSPVVTSTPTNESAILFNNFRIDQVVTASAKEQLTLVNGDVTVATSKSYLKTGLVATTIINTQASAVQVQAGLINRIGDNDRDNSTCCLMTFGNYMTDAELLEYSGLINTLMDSLVV